MEPLYRPFTTLGLILIASGLVLVLLPVIARQLPRLEDLPWFVVWVYRKDGFFFATSPLLIAISLVSLALRFLNSPP
jgi:hypothetical protein